MELDLVPELVLKFFYMEGFAFNNANLLWGNGNSKKRHLFIKSANSLRIMWQYCRRKGDEIICRKSWVRVPLEGVGAGGFEPQCSYG